MEEVPSLEDLRAFQAVAQAGSVRAAAHSLAVTHGAVSRRSSRLAREIEVPLVEREGRGIRLTPAGERLAAVTAEAFTRIREVLTELQARPRREAVVLSCERSLAMRWLIPRLSGFQDAHPEIAVHLSVGGGALDFESHAADLAIRRLDFPVDPRWRITPLVEEEVGPVMQPEAARCFAAGSYIGLGSRTRPGAWRDWLAQHPDAPRPQEIRYLDHHFLMVEGAASGLGVAICPRMLAMDDIDRGRLVAPLGFHGDGSSYGLIAPPRAADSRPIELLTQWIVGAFGASPERGLGR